MAVLYLRHLAVAIGGCLYVALFWLRPPASWPSWIGLPRRTLIDLTAELCGCNSTWAWVVLSMILGGVVPAIALLLLRRRWPPSLLCGGTSLGWKLAAIGYAIAFVLLLYLASRQGFRDYYARMMRGGLLGPALRFYLVIIPEHICIQGLILRLALGPVATWPRIGELSASTSWLRLRRTLGMGPGPGLGRIFGVDGNVLAALAAQALVFGWVHLSKDVGELLLSFPGGFALGYLVLRARSVWPCVALHAITGTTVIVLAILLFGMPVGNGT